MAIAAIGVPARSVEDSSYQGKSKTSFIREDDIMNMLDNSSLAGMSDSDHEDGKLFRIGQMAKQFGVTLRALRFYEDKGLIAPKRVGTTRLYSHRDRTRLKLILLGRKIGFSLRDVKQMLDLYDPKGSNIRQLKVTLEKSERQLDRLTKQRDSINEAISELSSAMDVVREKLSRASAGSR